MDKVTYRVFISYAWESEAFKDSIWDLAGWLEANGEGKLEVITDHLFANRPPSRGWPAWMQDEIKKADIVLIVCTPMYIDRFEKNDTTANGAGGTFEGIIITQSLYNAKLINNKFYPILPDGGSVKNIPLILQAYSNGHCFPSHNEGILKLIFNDNPKHKFVIKSTYESVGFEKEIVAEIIIPVLKNRNQMLPPIQIIVRAFLSLNDLDKVSIVKALGIYSVDLGKLPPHVRDKEIFKRIKEKDLLDQLWIEVNKIKPFENNSNPFKKS